MSRTQFRNAFGSESEHVEWKAGASSRAIQQAVVAFSNTDGGVVLIGVRDDGEVVGREPTQGLLDDLHRALSEVHNPGSYEVHALDVEGTAITVLAVARRVEGVAQTPDGRVLVAKGTRKEPLFGSELQRIINERSLGQFDRSPANIPLAAAPPERVDLLCQAYGWADSYERPLRMEERGLLTLAGGAPMLTVAGALCLLDDPQRHIGKAYVEVLRYPDGGDGYDRREQIEGAVDTQVARSAELVASELGEEQVVLGLRRHQLPRLPRRVLREALANAVAHRSYEQAGRAVRIELRPDAVKIISPGGFPEPVTEGNIRDTQAARNPAVIDVLRRLRLAEDAGLGIDVIEDLMRDELLDPPRFQDTGHTVEVTLPIRSAVTAVERAWVKEVESRGAILPADRILLVHAARGERLTNGRARALLATDALAARAALRRLRDAGFVRQEGRRSGTVYVLDGSLAPPAGLYLRPPELRRLVLDLSRELGAITNTRVRERTGLDRVEALRVLDQLVREGLLRRVGARRGTHYVTTRTAAPGQDDR
jgi:ATP-dependent DNA helicase RecG